MSDLIRRADALRVLKDDWDASFSREDFERAQICQFHFLEISNLPTVNPRVGKGKIEEMVNIWGKGYRLTCLECGDVLTVTEDALPYERYCRCCGVLIERSE